MSDLHGIHHITAIAGDAQENLDFYAGVLGMRLVKRSVNQDSPGTYHLFYADAEGHPGSDLTFFPWPELPAARRGVGLGSEISLAVPVDTLSFWRDRLERHGINVGNPEVRRGERVLPITDPHGLPLTLTETRDPRQFTPWDRSPIPENKQILGLHSLRVLERDLAATSTFLIDVLGFRALGAENGWHRFALGDGKSGAHIEVGEQPDGRRGSWGTGSMHHVAWRVPDEEVQLAVREKVQRAFRRPTEVIDRFWFKSVYFTEPGGVLFELATDGPGFTADEDLETLGERLVLPPWLEPSRKEIEAQLPALREPDVLAVE
ncbi:MAG TPA: ring-cleaving dioxygenase [Gemmatimonadaceae bacterium]|nr:ring-cleaving dioxygenase [Gemmatimonadaceae bacterium]